MESKRKPGIFYGWWIVTACFIMAMYSSGIIGYGFTAVFEPITKQFGWSYAQVSWASSIRGVEIGIFAPIVGYLVDRFGAKPVIFTGGLITGLGLLVLSRINSLWMFYAAFGLISLGSSACSVTAFMAAVASWFSRKVGLTMGIMSCGFGFAGFMVPVVTRLVDTLGWQRAMGIFGIGSFIILLPLSLLLRRRPEDYGLLPDGDVIRVTPSSKGESPVRVVQSSLTTREAFKTRAFWFIALVMSAQHMIVGAVITHVMPYLGSVGIVRATASLVATLVPLASIGGRFGSGWLGMRITNKRVAVIGFALMTLGLLSFSYSPGTGWLLLVPFIVCYGIGFGSINNMRGVLTREYFGARYFGTILGLMTGVGTIGSVAGAPLAGYVYDKIGSYQPVWLAFVLVTILCFILMAMMPPSKATGVG